MLKFSHQNPNERVILKGEEIYIFAHIGALCAVSAVEDIVKMSYPMQFYTHMDILGLKPSGSPWKIQLILVTLTYYQICSF